MVNHPNRSKNSLVGTITKTKLRALYQEWTGFDWPEDDAYLVELWLEARRDVPRGGHKVPPAEVFKACLMSMRECHYIAAFD